VSDNLQRVGPVSGSSGTLTPLTAGFSGGQRTQDAHARYMDAVLNGNVWLACNIASTAVTALNATATGLILTNPAGSNKWLVLWDIGVIQTSTATTTANAGIVLAANVNPVAAAVTHTTPLSVRNCLLGASATSVGLADSSATLPAAPVRIRAIWQPSVSATAAVAIPPVVLDNIDGKIALLPGTSVSLSAESALSCIAHITWEEVSMRT
jgi:hypothetical protein